MNPPQDALHRRRRFLMGALSLAAAPLTGPAAVAAENSAPLPKRRIPRTGELLPVIGLGSTKGVSQLADRGTAGFEQVLRTLLAGGGRVVDTWSRDPALDRLAGTAFRSGGMIDEIFLATKVDAVGAEAGRSMLARSERDYDRASDLVQVFNLRDVATQWPLLREWRDAGRTRYIGATVSSDTAHEAMMRFMKRERPDCIQVNYSVAETSAEDGVLPLAAELGVAVIVNRPFMNGRYFSLTGNAVLPAWTSEFDCFSWAEFSLKYILANPAVTCVLTETTNPKHMRENLGAARSRYPDPAARERMRALIRSL